MTSMWQDAAIANLAEIPAKKLQSMSQQQTVRIVVKVAITAQDERMAALRRDHPETGLSGSSN